MIINNLPENIQAVKIGNLISYTFQVKNSKLSYFSNERKECQVSGVFYLFCQDPLVPGAIAASLFGIDAGSV